jgi:hypothetical protein
MHRLILRRFSCIFRTFLGEFENILGREVAGEDMTGSKSIRDSKHLSNLATSPLLNLKTCSFKVNKSECDLCWPPSWRRGNWWLPTTGNGSPGTLSGPETARLPASASFIFYNQSINNFRLLMPRGARRDALFLRWFEKHIQKDFTFYKRNVFLSGDWADRRSFIWSHQVHSPGV